MHLFICMHYCRFMSTGSCGYGDTCKYAHGAHDLRSDGERPADSRQQSSVSFSMHAIDSAPLPAHPNSPAYRPHHTCTGYLRRLYHELAECTISTVAVLCATWDVSKLRKDCAGCGRPWRHKPCTLLGNLRPQGNTVKQSIMCMRQHMYL